MKRFYMIITMLITLLTAGMLAADNRGNASGSVYEIPFDVPVTCSVPLGTKALPAFFSFQSNKPKDKNDDGVKVAGQLLEGGRLMFTIAAKELTKSIISTSYNVDNGVLSDSGVVTSYKTKASYSYDFIVKCK
jgi:hypothetical protein